MISILPYHLVGVAPYARAVFSFGPVSIEPGLRLDGYLVQGSRSTPKIGVTWPPSPGSVQASLYHFVTRPTGCTRSRAARRAIATPCSRGSRW